MNTEESKDSRREKWRKKRELTVGARARMHLISCVENHLKGNLWHGFFGLCAAIRGQLRAELALDGAVVLGCVEPPPARESPRAARKSVSHLHLPDEKRREL